MILRSSPVPERLPAAMATLAPAAPQFCYISLLPLPQDGNGSRRISCACKVAHVCGEKQKVARYRRNAGTIGSRARLGRMGGVDSEKGAERFTGIRSIGAWIWWVCAG